MKKKILIAILLVIGSISSFSQIFSIGDNIVPNTTEFKLLGISSTTTVATYKYIGRITDKYYFNRQVSDIIIGLKNGFVVTTIYSLIPEKTDNGVPISFVNLVQATLPFPLAYRNGLWGLNIDNVTITISRTKSALTFNKDRIMYMSTVKNSILSNN